MAKLSPTLKAQIKSASRTAAANRLRGRKHIAHHHQSVVDSRVAEAERQGHGDEAFEAEMEGVQLAESQFSASKYDVTGALPKRDPKGMNRKALKRNARKKLPSRYQGRWGVGALRAFRIQQERERRKAPFGVGRDKQSARRRAKGRPLNPYSRFVKSHKGSGLTFSEIAKLWRRKKRAATTSTRLKRHVTKHTRKGTKMTTRALPKELLDLARALREASAKEPSAAKASAIERKMESLIRQLRAAQKAQGSKTRREAEAEEIRAQAREWAAKGPSGDPGRRKKSAYQRFLKAHKGKGLSLKALRSKWKRLSTSGKAKYGHAKKRKKAHRDPGYARAAHHRAHRARRHRGARRHHRPY